MNDVSSEDWRGLLPYAYFYLKFRPRTAREMRTYLLKKIKKRHWSTDDVEKSIQHLIEGKYLDDNEFIRWFVKDRSTVKSKGIKALRFDLQKLGIQKELLDVYFLNNEINEDDLAAQVLHSKWRRFSDLDKRKRFEKAAQFLARRGFGFDTIKKAIFTLEDSGQRE